MRSTLTTLAVCCSALLIGSAGTVSARVHGGDGMHASSIGHHRRGEGRDRTRANDRAAIYEVLQATNITDKPAFDQAIGQLKSTLASSSGGSILADADTSNDIGSGTPSGTAHASVLIFDTFQSSDDWEKSAAFQDLSKSLQKAATLTLMRVGGIRPAGASGPAPAAGATAAPDEGTNPGQQNARATKMIKIPDICRGC